MYLRLGERERQIMEVLYQRGRATVAEVLDDLADPPSYSAVRTMLGKLERKGLVRHAVDGPRYIYIPVAKLRTAQTSTLRRVVDKLFGGSAERTVAAILEAEELTDAELDRLEQLIDDRRRRPARRRR